MPKKRELLTANDVNGAWVILPTSAKDGAEDWRMTDTLDLDETARAIEGLIRAGVNGLLSMGTFGESATLTLDEKKRYMACLVESVRGRIPVFVGTTTLNTRDTIELTRYASDLGADGTMLGVPMWCAPSVATAARFYKDVAEGCPDMAICIYANPEAFKFDFPPPFWAQVAEIPQVITAKYIGVAGLLLNIEMSKRRIRLLPIELDYYSGARIDDFVTAFWSSGAVCGPKPTIALRDEVAKARQSGDWSRAKKINDEMMKTVQSLFPHGSFKEFSMYNIPIEKERMNAAGWMKAGPCRPPYHVVPEEVREGARVAGQRWAELDKRM
ncbi:MAG: dihydrodipicolinate synthase family protein [Candidatus Binataceae bacterium]|nr:dihydrodipicolinate synthase family protein [Candidatus Binataceae bacterium]